MLIVPLDPESSQTLTILLNLQECRIHVYQRRTGLYLDLAIAGVEVLTGALCLDRNLIVISSYLGFVGDLVFVDRLGRDNPDYSGLGSQFLLAYLLPEETTAPELVVPYWIPVPPAPTPPPDEAPIPPGLPTSLSIT